MPELLLVLLLNDVETKANTKKAAVFSRAKDTFSST